MRILDGVGSEDGGEHIAELFLEFRAAGRVVHFDALALAPDEAGFAEDLKCWERVDLGKVRLWSFRKLEQVWGRSKVAISANIWARTGSDRA